MEREHRALISELNEEQLQVYNSIMKSLQRTDGGFFFVYGSGGCGKTFLWKTLISKLRSESMIVLPVASSGIAATLLPGGRTAHSRFKIPIILDDCSTVPGLPTHELKLKVGVVVMLMRNLNQTLGLCNGTRMMVTRLLPNCVECEVISGNFVGTKHFIPRMELFPTDSKLPYKLMRKQMPLQICYAMTINKSQGQSLKNVGLYLPKPVFSHGQLYVAISRVTSPEGLRIYIESEMGLTTNITQNVVYKEVFNNLPCI
ncbi:hypothetical protein DCAR_0311789 [Daucus carota subsp. sativus]|uniref:ATP-dependent DNA helicase n=1 Tax=Daucus carota subsp. sativus TaxID=79200 RepID=A0AAF1AR97_DAUCS|nr:hypothetical protein DCAR_0311789 [Daucus carota subsp. sativus]